MLNKFRYAATLQRDEICQNVARSLPTPAWQLCCVWRWKIVPLVQIADVHKIIDKNLWTNKNKMHDPHWTLEVNRFRTWNVAIMKIVWLDNTDLIIVDDVRQFDKDVVKWCHAFLQDYFFLNYRLHPLFAFGYSQKVERSWGWQF